MSPKLDFISGIRITCPSELFPELPLARFVHAFNLPS
jgi:hypothetical protein